MRRSLRLLVILCAAAAQAQEGVGRAARPAVEDWVLANRHLRGRGGEALAVNLGAAGEKRIEPIAGDAGLRISLARFRSRMGPVRRDRGIEEHLSLVLELGLEKDLPELVCRIASLRNTSPYWAVETIEWPLRLFPVRTVEDDGYIVFPQEQGFLVPSRFDQAGYFRYLNWVWERIAGQALILEESSMPWFGARKNSSSFVCIVETPDDVAYGIIANDVRAPEQPPAPPSAVPSASTALAAPRGGYVEMCKTYRRYAQKTGRFVTLKRKIAENPETAKLIGAANFEIQVIANRARDPLYTSLAGPVFDGQHQLQTSFAQIGDIVRDLKSNLGAERAVIRITGWGRRGYDNDRPIDAAEPNVEAGGAAALAKALEAAKAAGYLGALWDNYRNFDLNSPSYDEKYILRDAAGALIPGFTSEAGHSQEICVIEGARMFERNLDYYLRALKPNSLFLDTIGGLPLVECYDARHPAASTVTREQRMNIMRRAGRLRVPREGRCARRVRARRNVCGAAPLTAAVMMRNPDPLCA
jgi:hypothetical protein